MENKIEKNFLEIPALRVKQPLGDFYVISIPAKQLLEISFSEPMKYVDNSGRVQGSQRPKDNDRLKEIAKYIDSVEMAFPNSIILAANYTLQGNITKDIGERWRVVEDIEKGSLKLIIPKKLKLAAVIDGQHRLNAFEYVRQEVRFTDLQLVCSVYFDLPISYQAFLFATINSNQKKVDRSLALELFGYNVDDESEKAWTPEKYAVFLSRKLNLDKSSSPLYKHIKVAPLNIDSLFEDDQTNTWVVSTATIVDGICSLISSNAKRDRILMQQKSFLAGRNREMIKEIKDVSPLRNLFVDYMDKTIYDTIINYFNTVKVCFWNDVNVKSYIIKTVGIQALFDVLKLILIKEQSKNPDTIDFNPYLVKASSIDFTDKFFQASGIGRSRIKNSIGVQIGVISLNKIKKIDLPFYEQIFSGNATNIQKEKWLWQEEAENAVINVLENAEWNFDSKTVGLYLHENDNEELEVFKTFDLFFEKLVSIAEIAFATSLPWDREFAEEQQEKFDPEDLVNSYLVDYEPNLKKIGWNQ